jgi:type I restriction-modification system DNA methylase subunit
MYREKRFKQLHFLLIVRILGVSAMSIGREVKFQVELWSLLRNICLRGPIGGIELEVTMEEPVIDARRPDIVVSKKPEHIPILIIETKKKGKKYAGFKFTPYDPSVVAQAFSYAALAKGAFNLPLTPLFATANPDVVMLLGPVEDPWQFLNRKAVQDVDYENALSPGAYTKLIAKYYIFDESNPLREELAFQILDTAVKLWRKEVEVSTIRKEIGLWFIDNLRYFVEYMNNYYVREPLRLRLSRDQQFYSELDSYARRLGHRDGLVDIVGQDLSKIDDLSRMMVYVLMNKIIFYKVLENYYKLPQLKPFAESVTSSVEYLNKLNTFFENAVSVSGDFEQIFYTGLYDKIVLADDIHALIQIDELIKILSGVDIQEFSDIIGHVYENLIPAEERHRLGQFYTPRPIAELITKWCIRSGDDIVLGPGCGSGTFEVEAYWRLIEFKTGRRVIPSKDVHRKVLKQIFAVDINSFPCQLTSINLAMKNVLAPVTDLNVIESDFFAIHPKQELLLPYKIQTPEGSKQRKIKFPEEGFDAVFGNPPYTRWTEIAEPVKNNILEKLGGILTNYNLHADIARGKEPGIYIHFIMWAREFLKPGGRLGMIISNSWLQSFYGEDFARYLTENWRVKALVDISARVFPIPLIGTCILLLEKPTNGEDLGNNDCVFLYLNVPEDAHFEVNEILSAIRNPEEYKDRLWIKTYKQKDIAEKKRWLHLLFDVTQLLQLLQSSPHVCRLKEFFKPCRGNTIYQLLVNQKIVRSFRDVGGEDFFYLTEREAMNRGFIPDFVYPLLPSSDCMRFYTFTREDWNNIRNSGKECYIFLAHAPQEQLPENVRRYIQEGETSIFLRRRKGEERLRTVNLSQACQARARHPEYFYGWYDLGGVQPAPIYAAYGVQYLLRFTRSYFSTAVDHRILALFPRKEIYLSEEMLKALLAFLNSSFTQIQVEARGRTTGGGMLELDIKPLEELLVIHINKLGGRDIERLANLFDELESEARRLGGQDVKENVERLYDTVIKKIDYTIAELLGIGELEAEVVRTMVKVIMERRLSRAAEARRDVIKGESEDRALVRARRRPKSQTMRDEKVDVKLNNFLAK